VAPEEEKVKDTCTIYVGLEFPAYKKKVLEILSTVEFDEADLPIGKWQTVV